MPMRRARRNSDSFVYVSTQESEERHFYSKLRQAENKCHQEKIESLEKEIETLKAHIEETDGLPSTSKKTSGGSHGELHIVMSSRQMAVALLFDDFFHIFQYKVSKFSRFHAIVFVEVRLSQFRT